jgi:hypothetical protein
MRKETGEGRRARRVPSRLFFREATYPWESPQHDLAEARRLIFRHGYLRRKEELEDAEAALKQFVDASAR